MSRLLALVALIVSLAGFVAGTAARSYNGSGVGRAVTIDRITLTQDRLTVEMEFVGGPVYDPSDPCSIDYEARGEWRDDVLEVEVIVTKGMGHHHPGGSLFCNALGHFRRVLLELDRPFTGSEIRDANGPRRRLFRKPEDLAVVTGLPSGWEIQVQSDDPNSRAGGWMKVYGPYDDTSRQVVFVQAFDAKTVVRPVDHNSEPVTVGGTSGRTYRRHPHGELVIEWRPGRDGYALFAFEDVFSLEELLALAETVVPGR